MIDNVRLIQHGSLNTKRQVVILLAQDADGESVTEVVKRLADPACWEALNEAIEPLVLHAEEEFECNHRNVG